MTSSPETVLCQYHYDPLDRLISHALPDIPERRRFYCKSRLATEVQGAMRYSIVQHGNQLLAQQRSDGDQLDATLLATDQQRSVVQTLKANHPRQAIAYSPYGHRSIENGLLSLLGFNGERSDPVTGCYLLGNGYRAFNPMLMRFNSPDSWSPFGKGGLNAYAYCAGDPINQTDPTGHVSGFILARLKLARRQRAKTLINSYRETGHLNNPKLTLDQVADIIDQRNQIIDTAKSIKKERRALIKFDYENRTSPNLQNIASDTAAKHGLELNDLPPTVQNFAKIPARPLNSRDLLEFLNDSDFKPEHLLDSMYKGRSFSHSSGREIDLNTAKAYHSRIIAIRQSELIQLNQRYDELFFTIFPRYQE